MKSPFAPLYEFFIPFFFVGIGLNIDPKSLTVALRLGSILLVVAALGKIIGNGGPALITLGWRSSVLIDVSMVPRAEIAMIIMKRGGSLGK